MKVLLDELRKRYPEEIRMEIHRLDQLGHSNVSNICEDIPEEIMAPLYKEWVINIKLVMYRIDWLKGWYKGG
ncbi:MAG: hypothetical protein ACE3JN_16145 [Ectobacillus sp.]